MLSRVVSFALSNRTIILVLAGVLLVVGLRSAAQAPVDVFPEFAPPEVSIQTEAPGLSTSEVEALVTIPLEQSLNGAPGLVTLRSSSAAGISAIVCVFADGTDVYLARQMVNERLGAAARRLPASVEAPGIIPIVSASSTLLDVGLTAPDGFDPMALREIADWTLRPRLLAVPGVSRVTLFGGGVRQYQVLFDPAALRGYDIGLDQAVSGVASGSALAAAGFLRAGEQSLPIRAQGQVTSLEDLKASVIAWRTGVPITVAQVGQVRFGPEFKVGDGTVDGRPGVVIEIDKLPGANTLSVTRDLEAALQEMARSLPAGVAIHPALFRQATFVERALHNLRESILIGALLVAIVLGLFLADLRSTLVSLLAIPLSLLTAVVVLRAFGTTLNTMTLGGMAIALGGVVDDAIIDVENTLRRLRQSRGGGQADARLAVILGASLEVRRAIVHATFIVVLVVMPLFFLSGLQGKLFAPLGASYVLATLASLVVAVTVTPVLASLLLKGTTLERGEGRVIRVLKRLYAATLERVLARPRLVVGAAALVCLLALGLLPLFGVELLPDFQEGNLIVHVVGPPGISLESSVAAGVEVEKELHEVKDVLSTALKAGRAEMGEDTWGPENTELMLALSPGLPRYDGVLAEVRRRLAAFPGFAISVKEFLKERIEEVISGTRAEVVLRLQGPQLEVLRAEAERDAALLADVRGATQVQSERQAEIPQVEIHFDRAALARHGLTMDGLRQAVTTALWGVRAGQVYEGQKVFDIWVRSRAPIAEDPKRIGEVLVDTPDGGRVPLAALARIDVGTEPNVINRQGGTRQIVVTAATSGRDVGGFVEEARRRIDARPLPSGYFRTWGGEYEAERAARSELLLLGLLTGVGVFLLLMTDFRSARLSLLVLGSLPLALVGGVAAAALAGGRLSLGSLVGFVTLFGIAMRNSIMMVSHFRHLETVEGKPAGAALVREGSLDRLSPILMTALVTGLGLLPLAIWGARAGQEIEQPMAVVILGGLASSTALNLLVLPPAYLRWWKPSGHPSRG